nr:type II secretion system protein [Geminisphaera colitermitum]
MKSTSSHFSFSTFQFSAFRAKSAAFTLIELLTVIAIIGILAALSFIGYGRVMDRARTTQCLSNLRQLALTHLIYVSENKQQIAMGHVDKGDLQETSWTSKLAPYLNLTEKQLRYGKHLACPATWAAYPTKFPTQWEQNKAGPSIGINPAIALPVETLPQQYFTDIQNPSKVILFADEGSAVNNDYANPWNRNGQDPDVQFIHVQKTKMNVVFLDAHTATLDRAQTKFTRNAVSYPWTERPLSWLTQ